ncbi:WSC domain-containing protein [Purpureocillium lilacinum]|uniref:WSC domain-containing protein n=1 Tax=Purpureocillium lilacinum TaxID=33203 RepID=A0A179H6S5_PURLI|nr:WSC domain-containing protein [Purpureocillium lilacinum]OAQ85857.1 WSC domain-containing protein [Purpureocillium lilacinum]
MTKLSLALSAGLIAGANAFWRMECPGRVGLARMDPIVNPGSVSNHVHAIHGSSGFSETANSADLLKGGCTSCRVTQDLSSYWTPALYFQDEKTGKYEIVQQVGGMLAYYLLYGNNITAFPTGFRMLSGTNERRTYTVGDPNKPDPDKSMWASLGQTKQEDLEQRAIGFNCLNYAKTPEGTLYRHYMPDKQYLDANCKDGIRLEIMFPSCSKGTQYLDSENHKDHVAFPDLVMSGTCPDTHPVRLPSLLYEVIWNTNAFKDRKGKFVFSNGDTTGYGYHGDFMMGWDESFLQKAVDTCTNPSGRIQDCPLFNVVSEAKATACGLKNSLPQALFGEDVKGPMIKLPGGMTGSEPAASSPAARPSLTYKPGEKPSAPASPLPGQIFKASSSAPAVPTTTAVPTPSNYGAKANPENATPTTPTTPPPPPPPASTPAPDTQSYYSTQYVTNGNVVSKILWQEQLVYVTQYVDAVETAAPGAARRRRGAHLHGRHGKRL